MAEIEVRVSKLKNCASNQKSIGKRLNTYDEQIRSCSRKLQRCLDVGSYSKIQSYLNQVSNGLEGKARSVESMGGVLLDVANVYRDAEKQIAGQKVSLQKAKSEQSFFDVVDLGPLQELIETVIKIWSGDMSDWGKNLIDLPKNAASVWKDLYDSIDSGFLKKLFNIDSHKVESELGNVAGFVGWGAAGLTVMSAIATLINTEGKESGEIASDAIKAIGSLKAIVGQIKVVPWQIRGLVSMGVEIVAQGTESVMKYSADGKYDFDDFIETAIDTSTAGLLGIFGGITGIEVDEDAASETLKNGAKNIGTNIGETIKSVPSLKRMMTEGNIVERVTAFGMGAVLTPLMN